MKIFLTSLACIVLLSGCCNLADCDENGGFVSLRIMNNDKNALFGPDAIIPLDDVKVYEGLEKDFEQSYNIYVDSIGAIQIFVSSYHPTILEIGSIRTDTFILTTEVISHGECGCHGYDVTSVTRNGEVICTGDCEEIMEIEL